MPLLKSLSDGLEKLRGNPITVALVLLVAAVSALASFTDSVGRLTEFFARPGPETARADLSRLGIPFTAESLQEKARTGDLVAVEKLLQAGLPADAVAENADADDPNLPALAEAAGRGDLAMAQVLLANHADPAGHHGAAVTAAARHGHIAVLERLLKQHPSENIVGAALIAAASAMKLDVVRMLAARLANPKPALGEALGEMAGSGGWGAEELVELDHTLFLLGANPNVVTADGITPLMRAAADGPVEQVRVMIEAGAHVNERCTCPDWNGGGWTALGLAAQEANADKIVLLITAGADVNVRSTDGETPLLQATRRHDIKAVKALLDAKADVSVRSRNGEDAVTIASKGYVFPDKTVYFPELVELLSTHAGKR